MADRRDATTWVALELTKLAEKMVEDGTFINDLRRELGRDESWPVFVPARSYDGKGKNHALFEGYAFVGSGLDEVTYFRLEQTKLVEQVLHMRDERGMKIPMTITDEEVSQLRRQLNDAASADIVPGMEVTVTEGVYAKVSGKVIETVGDHAIVLFELRSLQVCSKVPKVFLEPE